MLILTIRTDKPEAEVGLFEISVPQALHSDGMRGAVEQRSKPYMKYGERVAESATKQSAENTFRITISASKQESVVQRLGYEKWQAHRELSITIHKKILEVLKSQKKGWNNLGGLVCYKGPGSFTGLRIGLTVGNALASGLGVPIVSTTGKDWAEKGINKVNNGQNEKIALPKYGAPVHITKPRK